MDSRPQLSNRAKLDPLPGPEDTQNSVVKRMFSAPQQKHILGYADAFAAELAIEHGAWLETVDPEFSRVGHLLSIYSLPRHEK